MALPSSLEVFFPALVLSFGVTATNEFAFVLFNIAYHKDRPNTQHKPVYILGQTELLFCVRKV